MHSPRIPRLRKPFPPENGSRPPLTADPMQTAGRSSLHGNSPDSVIPVHGPLMPERGSLPSSLLLYHARARRANGKHLPKGGKTTSDAFFSEVVKFAGQVSRTGKERTASLTLTACRKPDCSAEENVRTKKPHRGDGPGCGGKPVSNGSPLRPDGIGETDADVQIISA